MDLLLENLHFIDHEKQKFGIEKPLPQAKNDALQKSLVEDFAILNEFANRMYKLYPSTAIHMNVASKKY